MWDDLLNYINPEKDIRECENRKYYDGLQEKINAIAKNLRSNKNGVSMNTRMFAVKFREAVASQGLDMECVMRSAVVSYELLDMWIKGIGAPSCDTVVRCARVLNVTTDYLLGLSEKSIIVRDIGKIVPEIHLE